MTGEHHSVEQRAHERVDQQVEIGVSGQLASVDAPSKNRLRRGPSVGDEAAEPAAHVRVHCSLGHQRRQHATGRLLLEVVGALAEEHTQVASQGPGVRQFGGGRLGADRVEDKCFLRAPTPVDRGFAHAGPCRHRVDGEATEAELREQLDDGGQDRPGRRFVPGTPTRPAAGSAGGVGFDVVGDTVAIIPRLAPAQRSHRTRRPCAEPGLHAMRGWRAMRTRPRRRRGVWCNLGLRRLGSAASVSFARAGRKASAMARRAGRSRRPREATPHRCREGVARRADDRATDGRVDGVRLSTGEGGHPERTTDRVTSGRNGLRRQGQMGQAAGDPGSVAGREDAADDGDAEGTTDLRGWCRSWPSRRPPCRGAASP